MRWKRVARQEGGTHADEIETSLYMGVRPELVQLEKARDNPITDTMMLGSANLPLRYELPWSQHTRALNEVQRGPLGTMGPSTHAYGGTRMGDNVETNVVDRYGFSHEAPNLGILGASVMGTSGAHNPTLTVQALAWRTAEHLVKKWRSRA